MPAMRESVATSPVTTAVGKTQTLTTTLYDLIAAIQEVVGPHDDALVVATTRHILHAGHATWGGQVAA